MKKKKCEFCGYDCPLENNRGVLPNIKNKAVDFSSEKCFSNDPLLSKTPYVWQKKNIVFASTLQDCFSEKALEFVRSALFENKRIEIYEKTYIDGSINWEIAVINNNNYERIS